MQDLSLQLNQVSPVKKGATQAQTGFQAAERNDASAPNAFADLFKKQVNQQKAQPAPAPNANDQAQKSATANKRHDIAQANQTASASKQAANAHSKQAQMLKEQHAKPNTANAETRDELSDADKAMHDNQGIQDLVLMQLGLQVPVQAPAAGNIVSTEPLSNPNTEPLTLAGETATDTTATDPELNPVLDETTGKGQAQSNSQRTVNPQVAGGLSVAQQAVALTNANSKEVLARVQADAETLAPSSVARPEFTMQAQPAANQAAQAVASTHQVATAFGKADWNQAIHQRVVYMLGAGEQTATLTLNPPNLGPLQVVIKVDNDHVDTTFMSNNADVRQALQDGLGMLKDKLNESGMQLNNANVSSHEQSQRDFQQMAQQRGQQRGQQNSQAAADEEVGVTTPLIKVVSNGLVDTFA